MRATKFGGQESGLCLLWGLNTWPEPEAGKRKGHLGFGERNQKVQQKYKD